MSTIDWTQPNRQADLVIAEHVFGETEPSDLGFEDGQRNEDSTWTYYVPDYDEEGIWMRSWTECSWPSYYTRDIAAAWSIVEHLRPEHHIELEIDALYVTCDIFVEGADGWINVARETGKTAPLAICHAAYLSMQEEG